MYVKTINIHSVPRKSNMADQK